jgi:hypothetical protein
VEWSFTNREWHSCSESNLRDDQSLDVPCWRLLSESLWCVLRER